MKIVVIQGSPRGSKSNTRRLTEDIRVRFPEHAFAEIQPGVRIQQMEKDAAAFDAAVAAVEQAEAVIWSFPVYVLLAPSQLKRFVELIHERGASRAFQGKYATTVTTSANFYDHTAQNYMRGVSEDLGMAYVEGYSPSMFDLVKEEQHRNLAGFAKEFFLRSGQKLPQFRASEPAAGFDFTYRPPATEEASKTGEGRILVLHDARSPEENVARMVEVFGRFARRPVEAVSLYDIDMKGGCLGCGHCMAEGVCAYKDGYMEFFRDKVLTASAFVHAGTIRDRYLSARYKMFLDRSFFNGHRPMSMGKCVGYLISGPLRQLPNLRQTLDVHAQVGRMDLVDIVTDECQSDAELTERIRLLAEALERRMTDGWHRPETFLGVGGHKVFRDMVYRMRALMVEDDKFYRAHGFYDFPNVES